MFQTEGEYRAAALDSMRKRLCFLSTEACNHIVVVTQNTIVNLKMRTMSPLSQKTEFEWPKRLFEIRKFLEIHRHALVIIFLFFHFNINCSDF